MRVVEIFDSVQGEGRFVGHPAVFVRFAGCNLYLDVKRFGSPRVCEWCDSKYSWDDKNVEAISPKSLVTAVLQYKPKMVVLTGGEPLYQPEDELVDLVTRLKRERIQVHVETNGTIRPPLTLDLLVDHFEISPKLHLGVEYLQWGTRSYDMALKFVYGEDEEKLAQFVSQCVDFYKCTEVRVMPRCKNRKEFLELASKVVTFCKRHGYIFGCREHIVIWDGARGK